MNSFLLAVACCLALCQVSTQQGIKRVGNDIKASTSGADWGKTTFLLHDTALADGIIFAFSAYFRNQNPVHFQIWRKGSAPVNNFTLVHEWPFSPAVSERKEDIYIHTRQDYKCIRVKEDDRLGIYFDQAPGSVAYTFQSDGIQTYQYEVKNGTTRPTKGTSVLFDTLPYPYRFSAAAYIDTDVSKYSVNANGVVTCPTTVTIPLNIPPQGTGRVGATGATGPAGAVGATGPAGKDGANGLPGVPGQQGLMGFQGVTGATGPEGPAGATGLRGPAGANGKDGAPGARGRAGPPGPSGKGANTGPSSIEALLGGCEWCEKLLNPYLILGLIIWLIIITILALIIIACYIHKRRQRSKYKDSTWSSRQEDLWKKYEGMNGTPAKVPSYENPAMDATYDAIDEGRTVF